MKWLSGLLLIINLAFISFIQWNKQFTDETKEVKPFPKKSEGEIKLLVTLPPVPEDPLPPAISAISQAHPATAEICAGCKKPAHTDHTRASPTLTTLKLADQLIQQPTENPARYWVYLPPAKTRAEMDRNIAELKKHHIKDYFTMQGAGPWKNAISLGVFHTDTAAHKVLATLHATGIKTAVMGKLESNENPE